MVVELVKRVGAERVALLAVDPHKEGAKMRLTTYCGDELIPPTEYRHTASDMGRMMADVEAVAAKRGLLGVVAGVELAGRNHRLVKRTLRGKWPVRMIHPYVTSHLRRPASPGVKSDDVDLEAMECALRDGYGFEERELPPFHRKLREWSRAREELVAMCAAERCRFLERLQELMPGYARLFGDLWDGSGALALVELVATPAQLRHWSADDIRKALRKKGARLRGATVGKVMSWAADAPDSEPELLEHRREILLDCLGRTRRLAADIDRYEAGLFGMLVQHRGVLLLGAQGVNVVSAASYVAELGPVDGYIAPKHIAGRAGLYPSRSQSGATDHADGPMVKARNAWLRDALMELARGLTLHNAHFKTWAGLRRPAWSTKLIWVSVANHFARASYHILTEGAAYRHPSGLGHEAVTPKLLDFALQHGVGEEEVFQGVELAARQLPANALPMELDALADEALMRRKLSRKRPSKELLERIVKMLKSTGEGAKLKGGKHAVGADNVN